MTTRWLTDDMTAGEMFALHQADEPECKAPGLSMRTDGYGCQVCGWLLLDPDVVTPGE